MCVIMGCVSAGVDACLYMHAHQLHERLCKCPVLTAEAAAGRRRTLITERLLHALPIEFPANRASYVEGNKSPSSTRTHGDAAETRRSHKQFYTNMRVASMDKQHSFHTCQHIRVCKRRGATFNISEELNELRPGSAACHTLLIGCS